MTITDEQVKSALRSIREGWYDYEDAATGGNVDPDASALVVLSSAFRVREPAPAESTMRAWLRGDCIPHRPAWRARVVERGQAVARVVDQRTAEWSAWQDADEAFAAQLQAEQDEIMSRREQAATA